MSSFLEYVPGTSPLHRMNPVAKLAAAAAFARSSTPSTAASMALASASR